MQTLLRKLLIVSGLALGTAVIGQNAARCPPVCTSGPDIAFLIRVGSGRWIANGTVLR